MRGQAHTLEAIAASLLLVGGLVFALQATAVTPLSASTSSQHVENQQQAAAEGALAVALEEDAVRVAVLNWNASNASFYGSPGDTSYYANGAPSNQFGDIFARTFNPRGVVFNVYVVYESSGDQRKRRRMVYRGQPSDNAVSASVSVTLYDDDPLYNDTQERVVVNDESHTFDGSSTYLLGDAPVVPGTVHDVHDASGDTYERHVDYRIIDSNTDGKLDTIEWIGNTPDSSEQFFVDYTPAIDGDDFYAPDVGDSGVYNVVEVEVIAWRQ